MSSNPNLGISYDKGDEHWLKAHLMQLKLIFRESTK